MTTPLRKATEIVGWTLDGAAYCSDHAPDWRGPDGAEASPVFLSDVQPGDLTCDASLADDGMPCGVDLAEAYDAGAEWDYTTVDDWAYRAMRDDIVLSEPFDYYDDHREATP